MKFRLTTLLGTTAAAALVATGAFAQTAAAPAAPATTTTPFPALSADIAGANPPMTYDLGILGSKVAIGGVVSGLAYAQDNHAFGDQPQAIDLSNAQVFINKSDGVFQYYIQAGTYSLPQLGAPGYVGPYHKSSQDPSATFGNVPTAILKIVPAGPFSFEIGELPTLVGDEYVFTFQNLNITRGLLWGLEPAISRGAQVNYSIGPVAASVAFTDGFYSNKFNTVSGLVTWTIDGSNILAADFSVPTTKTYSYQSTNATFPQNQNSSVYNIMYTHTVGQWIINPYLQYTAQPEVAAALLGPEETWGAALLVNYTFDSKSSLAGLSIPVRVEYMSTNGDINAGAPDNLAGAGSKAFSVTVTPTYQYKNYFIRGEAAYVNATHVDTADGEGFGTDGTKKEQVKALLETGVLF